MTLKNRILLIIGIVLYSAWAIYEMKRECDYCIPMPSMDIRQH